MSLVGFLDIVVLPAVVSKFSSTSSDFKTAKRLFAIYEGANSVCLRYVNTCG